MLSMWLNHNRKKNPRIVSGTVFGWATLESNTHIEHFTFMDPVVRCELNQGAVKGAVVETVTTGPMTWLEARTRGPVT